MGYFAYALKYRPQSFQEVVGQEHVVISLKNAILKKHIHHAYLFSGPRGTGKTSLARIFAKSLNCEQGPTVSPCGKCTSCSEIAKSASLDIIEIDGASNNSVDNIRDLRENAKLSPANARFKIYIIDEVHMLSLGAFNALLKTLEEPPAHVKFIFATTHPQKVLPTILSRCQKFQFNLITLEKIVDKLKTIITTEGLHIDSSILYAIGRAAGGSIRDAESLLDQLAPVLSEENALKDVLSFLGIVDEESLNSMLNYIVEGDLGRSLTLIDAIHRDGKDLGLFLGALIEHFRNLLLAKVSINSFKELSDVSLQTKDYLLNISNKIELKKILQIMDLLIAAKDLSHKLNTVRIPFELALVKFSHQYVPGTVSPISQTPAINKPKSIPTSQEKRSSDANLAAEIDDLDIVKPEIKSKEIEIDPGPAEKDHVLFAEVKAKWREILVHIQRTRAAIASHLALAYPVSSQGSVATIAFSKKNYFHREIVESSKNVKFIESAISYIIGKPIGVKFVLVDTLVFPEGESLPSALDVNKQLKENVSTTDGLTDKSDDQGATNDFINELLDTFGGNLHTNED